MTAAAQRRVAILWAPDVDTFVDIETPARGLSRLAIAKLEWFPKYKHVTVTRGFLAKGNDPIQWIAWDGAIVQLSELPSDVRAALISACLPGDM